MRFLRVLVYALAPLAIVSAQVRDAARPVVGTGVISGTVVSDDASARPLRRVTLMLSNGDLRLPRTATSDDAGRYLFQGLPPGNYTVVATRPGYVSAYYGSRKPGRGPGVSIALLDGQTLSGITITLLRGGVISGTLRRDTGRAAVDVPVQVAVVDMMDGARHITTVSAATPTKTDDRGMYRIYGLAPGTYVVQAKPDVNSTRQVTGSDVQWAQTAGSPNGAAASVAAPPPPAPDRSVSYAPVYAPGTPDAAAATLIALGPGEERDGVDFSTSLVPTAAISGVVLDANGDPFPAASVTLRSARVDTGDVIEMLLNRPTSMSGRDGGFTISGVTPGRYTLTVRASPRSAGGRGDVGRGGRGGTRGGRGNGDLAMIAGIFGNGAGGADALWATEDVSVDGVDVSGVTLRLQPGMKVSGKIVVDGASLPPPDLSKARVNLAAPKTGSSAMEMAMSAIMASMTGGGVQAEADGTFDVQGVMPDKYRVNISMPGMLMTSTPGGRGWVLKSAMLNGRDVSDAPFEVKPGEDVNGLVLTLTDRPTELSGAVTDPAGRAASSYTLVIFSTDRTYWTTSSRRVQQAHPASDGKFTVVGLPAGDYYVCAVTEIDPGELTDRAFLETLAGASIKVSLADGEKKTQDLRLGGS